MLSYDLPHWNGRAEVMHLMSLISPLDDDLALVYPRLAPVRLMELLHERGIEIVEVPDEEFETMGPNVLALGPRRALALEGNDETRRRMEAAGVDVLTYRGDEISRKGDGGPTCLTRPLLRGMNVFELIDAGDADALRDELDADPELAESAERRRPLAGAVRPLQRQSRARRAAAGRESARSTSSTRPRSGGRAGSRSCSTPSPSSRRPGRRTASPPCTWRRSSAQEDAAKILLERGAEVNLVARNANIHVTPLHSAAAGSHPGIVKLLLEHGADPNAAQDGGFTPLHSAAQNDDRESVEALLEAGADPSLASDEGKTPADLAGDATRDLVAQSH